MPQAWAAGSVFTLMQAILGIVPDAPRGKLYVDPAAGVAAGSDAPIFIWQPQIDIGFWRDGDETHFEVQKGAPEAVVRRSFGAQSLRSYGRRDMLARSLTSRDAALPAESLKALDWLNFFLAAPLMGFGPFVGVHLTENGWAPASIGAVLTISGLAGLTTQGPVTHGPDAPKRALVGVAVTPAALALTIFGLRLDFRSVAGAAIVKAPPAASLVQASLLSVWGWLDTTRSLSGWFGINVLHPLGAVSGCDQVPLVSAIHARHIPVAAALAIPLLWALLRIHGADIHFGRSCGAPDHHETKPNRVSRQSLFKASAFCFCNLPLSLSTRERFYPSASQRTMAHLKGIGPR